MLLVVLVMAALVAVRVLNAPGGVDALLGDLTPANNTSVLASVLNRLVAGAGFVGVLAVAGIFVKKVSEIVGNPLKIELRRYLSEPDYSGHVAFAEQFHRDFALIVQAYAKSGRVFVFIDDLDRCEVPKAAELVQAMHVLMASESKQLIFVLAIDRDIVAAALAAKYESLIPYLAAMRSSDPGVGDGRDAASLLRKARVGLDYGHDFLEKLIQLPFRVPEPAPENIDRLLDSLDFASATRTDPAASDVPARVIEVVDGADSLRVRAIVTALAPALEYNPRRIKQFVSMLRLQAYIAGATGLIAEHDGRSDGAIRKQVTLEQLGKFVAISLRWPRLVTDIEADRTLLSKLQRYAWLNPEARREQTLQPSLVRWAGDDALIEFLRRGEAAGNDIELGPYRLDTVDVNTLLRVSPARASDRSLNATTATPESDPVAPQPPKTRSVRVPRSGSSVGDGREMPSPSALGKDFTVGPLTLEAPEERGSSKSEQLPDTSRSAPS